jgi:cytochrome c
MKRIAVYFFIVSSISCNTQTKENSHDTRTDSLINTAGGIANSPYANGARLVVGNDCLTCHKLDKKSIGPSYYQISEKYPFDSGVVENLAHSIINGSKGLYGDRAMTPHPNVSFRDAKAMAAYILSLKHEPDTHPNTK